jgi:hypothetical protein
MSERVVEVASGYWLYDGLIRHQVSVVAIGAAFASSRHDQNEEIDPTTPIPETPDGRVYYVQSGGRGIEFDTMQAAIDWANTQPWAPIFWD